MALHRDLKNLLIFLLESGLTKLIWAEQQSSGQMGLLSFSPESREQAGRKEAEQVHLYLVQESAGQWPNSVFICSFTL